MKLYVNPRIEIKDFFKETIVTDSSVIKAKTRAVETLKDRGATSIYDLDNESMIFVY